MITFLAPAEQHQHYTELILLGMAILTYLAIKF